MKLFNKEPKPDVSVKVYLCPIHKSFYSVNKVKPKNKLVPSNLVGKPTLVVINGEKRGVAIPDNKLDTAKGHVEFFKEVTIPTEPIYIVSPSMVVESIRLISMCPDCKVVME